MRYKSRDELEEENASLREKLDEIAEDHPDLFDDTDEEEDDEEDER